MDETQTKFTDIAFGVKKSIGIGGLLDRRINGPTNTDLFVEFIHEAAKSFSPDGLPELEPDDICPTHRHEGESQTLLTEWVLNTFFYQCIHRISTQQKLFRKKAVLKEGQMQ